MGNCHQKGVRVYYHYFLEMEKSKLPYMNHRRQPSQFLQRQHHGARGLHRSPGGPSRAKGVRGEVEPQVPQVLQVLPTGPLRTRRGDQ